MSEAPTTNPHVPLDEVMLAMDVVDVLRHQQDLVERELNEDERRARLIARVRDIYAAQGIEVTEAVVARGVEALAEDRFTYRPPERTFARHLAEIYVDRATWARRALVVLVIVGAFLGWRAWAAHRRNRVLVEGFAGRVAAVAQEATTLDSQIAAARRTLARLTSDEASGTVTVILTEATRSLDELEGRLGRYRAETAATPLEPDAYPRAMREMDGRMETRRLELSAISEDVSRLRGQLEAVDRLRGLGGELERALAALAGLDISETGWRHIDGLRERIRAALGAGDEAAAGAALAELDRHVQELRAAAVQRRQVEKDLERVLARLAGLDLEPKLAAEITSQQDRIAAARAAGDITEAASVLDRLRQRVDVLDRAYELRIVSHPNERSGVWRHPADRPGTKNFYIIVDAVDDRGRPVRLSITNEEDRSTRTVSRFGIRVPEAVYEAVKADKLDNGIVDRALFGTKRRGRLDVEYRFEVAGGRITEW